MKFQPARIDEDELRRLWPSGLPDKVLTLRMGHGRGALYRRAQQIGLGGRRLARQREFEKMERA